MEIVTAALLILLVAILIIVLVLFIRGDIVSPRGIRKTFKDDDDNESGN